MTTTKQIGGVLRGVRNARGLSLHDVSSEAGISVATLSRIETDKQTVDVPLLITLSRVLHVTPSSLLGDEEGEAAAVRAPDAVARDHASRSSSPRAQVMASALKRPGSVRARLDSLLEVLDLIGTELRALQRELQRSARGGGRRR